MRIVVQDVLIKMIGWFVERFIRNTEMEET
jgi:hypothetical protein